MVNYDSMRLSEFNIFIATLVKEILQYGAQQGDACHGKPDFKCTDHTERKTSNEVSS